jgi:hypothetical protein
MGPRVREDDNGVFWRGRSSTLNFRFLIPVPKTSTILLASCSRGALHEASGVGQDRRPGTCLASTHSGGSGRPSGPEKGSATEVGWTGTGGGAKSPCGQVPGSTDQGLKTPGRSVERRCRGLYFPAIRETSCGLYTQGASFGAPSPLIVGGEKLKAQLARRRENASAWLFEIRIEIDVIAIRSVVIRCVQTAAESAS